MLADDVDDHAVFVLEGGAKVTLEDSNKVALILNGERVIEAVVLVHRINNLLRHPLGCCEGITGYALHQKEGQRNRDEEGYEKVNKLSNEPSGDLFGQGTKFLFKKEILAHFHQAVKASAKLIEAHRVIILPLLLLCSIRLLHMRTQARVIIWIQSKLSMFIFPNAYRRCD